MLRKCLSLFLAVVMIMTVFSLLEIHTAAADASVAQTAAQSKTDTVEMKGTVSHNHNAQDYSGNWSHPVSSYLVQNSDGTLTRVECLTDYENNTRSVIAEDYSSDGRTLNSKRTIPFELKKFGGFYSGAKYHFFVFSQDNPKESSKAEVLRIVKYSKSWKRLGAASVYGANTYKSIDAGSLRMTETGGKLYVHTCHEMYKTPDGLHHQANMTFAVNQEAMTVAESFTGVMNLFTGYVSHSFNQFIRTDGKYIYRVDHGDAYPRGISLTKASVSDGIDVCDYTVPIDLSKTGSAGDNWTGTLLGGFEVTDKNCLIAVSAVNYQNYDKSADKTKNIYIAVTGKDLKTTSVKKLTKYTMSSGISVYSPHLVKINNNQLLVIWDELNESTGKIYTRFATIDGSGKLTSSIYSNDYYLSDCQPILCKDGYVRWYVGNGCKLRLYTLNPSSLATSANKKAQAKEEHVEVKNLTLSVGDTYPVGIYDGQTDYKGSWWGYDTRYLDVSKNSITAVGIGSSSVSFKRTSGRFSVTVQYNVTITARQNLAVPKISKAEGTNDGLKLSWSSISSAERYCVFVKNGSGWKKLGVTATASYTDKTAKPGVSYTYTVRCVNRYGSYVSGYDKSGYTAKLLATPKITSFENISGGTKISWNKIAGAAKYRVFVKTASGWKAIATVAANHYTYPVSKSGVTYSYTVRCLLSDLKTYGSGYNNTGFKNKYVAVPALKSVKNTADGVRFVYNMVNGASKYRVFRKTAGGSWTKLADVVNTRDYCLDKTAKKGVTYCYTVRCLSADAKRYESYFDTKGLKIQRK